MTDNRLQKSREEEFINNDPQYNFGGWVPPVIFAYPTPSPTATITPTPSFTPTLTPTPTITPTPSAVVYDADYQAILTYATGQGYTLPSNPQKTLQNQLVVDLKSYGIWADLDIFYVFATDGDESYSFINWKNPNAYEATKSPTPSNLVFTTNEGWRSVSGTCQYIITNFITGTNGTGYTLNDASRIYYDYDNNLDTIQNGYSGNIIQGGTQPDRWNGTNVSSHSVNSLNLLSSAFNNGGTGLKMIQRTSSTIVNLYNNSATPNARTQTSTALDTNTHTILRYGSGSGNCSSNKCSLYGLGASLSGNETNLYNAINTYMGSI